MTSPEESVKPFQEMDKYTARLSSSLNEMRRNGTNTDVVLVCEDKEFPVHRLVLSAGSPYFKKLFQNDVKENIPSRVDLSHIKENILVCILDFLYLGDPSKLINESADDLMEIHKMSHIFGIDGLSDCCWELLIKLLTAENVVKIWNMRVQYTNEYDYEDILKFVNENYKSIIENDVYLTLNDSQMELLLKKIIEIEQPLDDLMFEGIMKWLKQAEDCKKEIVELFYYFNFDFVSKECMNQMLKSEDTIPRNDILKTYLEIQVLPQLKRKDQIEKIKKSVSGPKSKSDRSSLKLFQFGYQLEIGDNAIGNQFDALKFIDVKNPENVNVIKTLPISLETVHLCFHTNSVFYFIRKEPIFSKLYLTAYNFMKQSLVFDIRFFEYMYVLSACIIGNEIYIVGRYDSRHCPSELITHCYNQSSGKWKFKLVNESNIRKDILIAAMNLNGRLHILCRREETGTQSKSKKSREFTQQTHNSYMFYTKLNSDDDYSSTPAFKVEKKFVLDTKLVTVYKNKVYAFFIEDKSCSCFIYEPFDKYWNHFEVTLNEDLERPMKCCGTVSHGILFCTTKGDILEFDTKENIIKPFSLTFTEFQKGDDFIRTINKSCKEIFMMPIDI